MHHLVDLGHRSVGELLHLVLRATLLVLGYQLVLQQLLQVLIGVAAQVAHRYFGLFALVTHDLGELLAALLGQRRHRHAQQVALRGRVEAEVALANGLLDLGAHALFPRLHADRARVEQRHVGDLADRHRRAVVVDMHLVEDAGVRTPGANLLQLVLQRLDRLRHLRLSGFLDFGDRGGHGYLSYTWTKVPSSSPCTTRASAPGLMIENTLIGSFWSRHSANAVASITCRLRAIASSKLIDA